MVGSMGALGLTVGGVMYFHKYINGEKVMMLSMGLIILVMIA